MRNTLLTTSVNVRGTVLLLRYRDRDRGEMVGGGAVHGHFGRRSGSTGLRLSSDSVRSGDVGTCFALAATHRSFFGETPKNRRYAVEKLLT